MKIIISVILLYIVGFVPIAAQTTQHNETADGAVFFDSFQLLADEGVVEYGITHRSEISRDSVITELLDQFGSPDEQPNPNTFIWENYRNSNLHREPVDLEISVTNILQAETGGMTWIDIKTNTDSDIYLLKPDTETYDKFVSFFSKLIARHVDDMR